MPVNTMPVNTMPVNTMPVNTMPDDEAVPRSGAGHRAGTPVDRAPDAGVLGAAVADGNVPELIEGEGRSSRRRRRWSGGSRCGL